MIPKQDRQLSRRTFLKWSGAGLGMAALAACAAPAAPPASGPEAAPGAEAITLRIMLPGDRPVQMEEILAEAESRLAAANLPTTLDVSFIPWGADLSSKPSLALAAGEELDLVFDAPWNTLLQNIAQDFYIQLDDPERNLLEAYGPNILAARPEQMWVANSFDGKIMAIPLGTVQYQGRQWLFREDIRAEIDFPAFTTFEEMEAFLYAVKEAGVGMIPARGAGVTHALYHDFDTSLRGITNPDIRMVYLRNNDGVIRNMFDERDPLFWAHVERGSRWLQDGLVPTEIDPGDVYDIIGGRTVVDPANDFGPPASDSKAVADLGGELGWVTFFDQEKKRVSNFLQFNFIAVAHSSPNPERAIEFLNWANTQENYDLLAYGIEGVHWEPVGENEYRPNPDNLYRWYPYAWIWNPTHDRLNADAAPGANEWTLWAMDADNFEPDVLLGFIPDNEQVLNEVSQLNALRDQYYAPLDAGIIADVESWWAEYEAQAAPAARAVQEEYQRQADAFLANQ